MDSKWIKVTLFFPILDNDGNPFDKKTWQWWLRGILKISPGHTDMGHVGGVWKGYTDRCRWIMMVVSVDKLDEIREFLKDAQKRFKQETMYLDYHPVFFELVT
jgi:hypothetical protein